MMAFTRSNPSLAMEMAAVVLHREPEAAALVRGDPLEYPGLKGMVSFYTTPTGVLVVSDFAGLPGGISVCDRPVFALHIHEGGSCTGAAADPFADAGAHYNPGKCPHPAHAGDLPPLFSNGGAAFGTVLTDRFALPEIIGRTVIVHRMPDDFVTQPSGNAGKKIACGVIGPV